MAIGIGAANMMFTVLNETVLHPLPYPEAERLVALSEQSRFSDDNMVSWPDFVDWQRDLKSFSSFSAIGGANLNWTGSGQAERMVALRISSSLFSQLGVPFSLGRNFTRSEDKPGAAPAVILSQELWRSRFGSRRDILGHTMRLDDRTFTVVGVLPADFRFLYARDIYIPFALDSDNQPGRAIRSVARVIGKLKPGVTLPQAQNELTAVSARLSRLYPEDDGNVTGQLRPMAQLVAGPARRSVMLLSWSVALLLALTCANVASLLVASGMRRSSELQLRQAIGAARSRLLSQLLTESSLLCLAGSLLGLVLAHAALPAITTFIPTDGGVRSLPLDLSLNPTVMVFSIVTTAVVCLAAGLAPAFTAVNSVASHSPRQSASGHRGLSARNLLVAGQISLSIVLLVSAGLLTRSLQLLSQVDLGFSANQLLTARLKVSSTAYPTTESRTALYRRFLDQLQTIPDVANAAATACLPFGGRDCWVSVITPTPGSNQTQPVHMNAVSSGYRSALGLKLLRGRDLNERDDLAHPRIALVNQTFVSRYLHGRPALGQSVDEGSGPEKNTYRIVGVLSDSRREAPDLPVEPELFLSLNQVGPDALNLILRSRAVDTQRLEMEARRILHQINPDLPLYDVRSLTWYIERETANRRFPTRFLSVFAAIGLFLSMLGLYSLVIATVQSRTREIAIRVAIGATRTQVLSLALHQVTTLVVSGVLAGAAGPWAATRLLGNLLYGTEPGDPVTLLLSAMLFAIVAGAAILIPAGRALAVDPAQCLKAE